MLVALVTNIRYAPIYIPKKIWFCSWRWWHLQFDLYSFVPSSFIAIFVMDRCVHFNGVQTQNRCRWSFFYDNYLAFDAECAKHWKKKILLHFLSFKYLFPSISLFSSISWSTYACGHMTIMNCKRKSTWKGPRNFFYEKIHEKATWFASLFLNYPIYPNRSITLCQLQEGSN